MGAFMHSRPWTLVFTFPPGRTSSIIHRYVIIILPVQRQALLQLFHKELPLGCRQHYWEVKIAVWNLLLFFYIHYWLRSASVLYFLLPYWILALFNLYFHGFRLLYFLRLHLFCFFYLNITISTGYFGFGATTSLGLGGSYYLGLAFIVTILLSALLFCYPTQSDEFRLVGCLRA